MASETPRGADAAGETKEHVQPVDKDERKVKEAALEGPDREYVTGVRLLVVMAALTFSVYLMMLDMAIMGTVCNTPLKQPF